ncbi:MAG: indolepyruvate ferredoxin oxidoreductase subunit alpha [Chloroflexota bacterium]|nr:indolepyruvate ferredoxin oxidoreductase subunit alpha [Chloroflexota bacterium]
MKKLLSGNEAIALGAFHAGVMVGTAYPGTPSTEILETLATFEGPYVEWSTNEKVALEVGMGAAYGGTRALVSMKHVGLNVAADPFFTLSYTGVGGGLVLVSADDPGNHSSQNEQDNRHYARSAKIPMLEPSDSQEAYELTQLAFSISEQFDTPVLLRSTTRVSHSRSVVEFEERDVVRNSLPFIRNPQKRVMIPAHATPRHIAVEKRMQELERYSEEFHYNQMSINDTNLGIVSSGVAFQYAMEVFPHASYLKLGMSYPFPEKLLRSLHSRVEKIAVIEELDPFLEDILRKFGINPIGKRFFPGTAGELNPDIVADGARQAGLLSAPPLPHITRPPDFPLPGRPPGLCAGCPHTGAFYVLRDLGFYHSIDRPGITARDKVLAGAKKSGLIISGDIGCYTLSVLPPLIAMDTQTCMGASIGVAIGLVRSGIANKVVAVIGDSTFYHSGITGLIDAVYNQTAVTIIVLDNNSTAMTGYQGHPGTGISAKGQITKVVDMEKLVRGVGVEDVQVVDAFEIGTIKLAIRQCIERNEPSVIIVRGLCPSRSKRRGDQLAVDINKCDGCGACLRLGCPAALRRDEKAWIDTSQCLGTICALCQQVCPKEAIALQISEEVKV